MVHSTSDADATEAGGELSDVENCADNTPSCDSKYYYYYYLLLLLLIKILCCHRRPLHISANRNVYGRLQHFSSPAPT